MRRIKRRKRKTRLDFASHLRGIYERVAERLCIDPSYVSRVAREERKSAAIEKALRQEMKRILASFNKKRATASIKPPGKKTVATRKKQKGRR